MTDSGDFLGLEEWDVPTHSLLLVEPDRDADGFIPADSLPVAQAAIERLARPIGSTHTLENLLQATVHRYPLARVAGDRVLVIETDGAHMERLLRDMEPAVARFGLQMVAQPGAVPLAFGDETRDFRTRTLDYEVRFASRRGVPQLLRRMARAQETLDAQAGTGGSGMLAEFLHIASAATPGVQYIQSLYDSAAGGFEVEVCDGGPERHFRAVELDIAAAGECFLAWMDGHRDFFGDWERMEF